MNICITGGGTGGHLMIAEALAEAAKQRGHTLVFIGSTSGQDKKYFEHATLFDAVYFLDTTGVVNKRGFGKTAALMRVFQAFLKAKQILQKYDIDATYSVGGFSAAPASFATLFLKKPLFIHEQNAVSGKLNSVLKRYATSFISAYDKNSPIQGYPVKEIYFQTARVRKSLRTVIFLGGSQGAKTINELALRVAKELQSRGVKIIHQAGEKNYDAIKQAYKTLGVEVELYGFTQEIAKLIAQADLAVSRCGASTLWELTANGCPAFFIPYPYAAGDHQYYNAQFIVENEMGWCEREGEHLDTKLFQALQHAALQSKSEKLLQYAKKDVASKMIQELEATISL